MTDDLQQLYDAKPDGWPDALPYVAKNRWGWHLVYPLDFSTRMVCDHTRRCYKAIGKMDAEAFQRLIDAVIHAASSEVL